MKVAITGAKGMLGTTLMNTLQGYELFALDREECDITNPSLVCSVFEKIKPDVVIHCAAMTAVDLCESKQFEAWKINAFGTTNVAHACNKIGAKLIAISTDYVFDGELDCPYHEYDQPNGGLNIYAKSKWAAEQAVRSLCPNHLIARVSWLYGGNGPSFVHTMLRLAANAKREVLDWNLQPIPGLYAVGEIASALKFVYQGGGNLTECLVFGQVCGKEVAKLPNRA